MKKLVLSILALLLAATAPSLAYPPDIAPESHEPVEMGAPGIGGLLFHTSHDYVSPWGQVIIDVDVYNNYFGDFSKYHWVYTVHNISYEPEPPNSNGFSGFETTLPASVADIGDVAAPDGIGPWQIDCCSGLPVEWDLNNTDGAAVGGGTLPGETEVYSFTTSPRLVVQSTGWFHSWTGDIQNYIFDYPPGDGVEVPDVVSDPDQELCCWEDPAAGGYLCEILPAGECDFVAGTVVISCDDCPPVTPTQQSSWGRVKGLFQE